MTLGWSSSEVSGLMASPSLSTARLLLHRPCAASTASVAAARRVTCGPRDNRGKLLRGRTLSTEAILAVQALKRAAAAGDEQRVDLVLSTDFSRLIKSDLLAAVAELQRQDQWRLAWKAFYAARREPWYRPDLVIYADMVSTFARCRLPDEIDALVAELLMEKEEWASPEDAKGISRIIRALLAAEKGKLVANFYRELKKKGFEPDDFLFKFLIRGLRRLGEEDAANEVERDFEAWDKGGCLPVEASPA